MAGRDSAGIVLAQGDFRRGRAASKRRKACLGDGDHRARLVSALQVFLHIIEWLGPAATTVTGVWGPAPFRSGRMSKAGSFRTRYARRRSASGENAESRPDMGGDHRLAATCGNRYRPWQYRRPYRHADSFAGHSWLGASAVSRLSFQNRCCSARRSPQCRGNRRLAYVCFDLARDSSLPDRHHHG